MTRIYLDNNATTPLAPEVCEAMLPWMHGSFGNAASVHWFGQRAKAALDAARRSVASLIGSTANEIILTAGGTEADNLAVFGVAEALRDRGNHLITSSTEHPAVLAACRALEHRGFEVSYVGVDHDGSIRLEDLRASLRPETILISVMLANNETGALHPISEIVKIAKSRQVLVHTDAVQAVGKIPVNVDALGVDMLSLSAHKIHGPQGVGALYARKGVEVTPLLVGGSQERKRRAGTENVAGAVGLAKAAELAARDVLAESPRIAGLRDRLEQTILSSCIWAAVNGSREHRVPNTTNIGFEEIEGDALLMALDMEGVAASLGAACSSGSLEPSHVLKAMGVPAKTLNGSLRFSLSKFNTAEEVDRAAEIVCRVVDRLHALSVKSAE